VVDCDPVYPRDPIYPLEPVKPATSTLGLGWPTKLLLPPIHMPLAALYTYTVLGASGGEYLSPFFTLLFGKLIVIKILLI
jgi:hypothetical protein